MCWIKNRLKKLYQIWMKFGHALGWVNTRIILAIMFFLLFTPMGIILRLCGKDAMGKTYDPALTSYRKISIKSNAKQMEKPF